MNSISKVLKIPKIHFITLGDGTKGVSFTLKEWHQLKSEIQEIYDKDTKDIVIEWLKVQEDNDGLEYDIGQLQKQNQELKEKIRNKLKELENQHSMSDDIRREELNSLIEGGK